MNDRFFSCEVAQVFSLTQHFPRCQRTQHENQIHTMGSSGTLAALITSGWFRKRCLSPQRTRTGKMRDGVDGSCFNRRRDAP
jgi:hypothetical protein